MEEKEKDSRLSGNAQLRRLVVVAQTPSANAVVSTVE